jgi:hypothetical protein
VSFVSRSVRTIMGIQPTVSIVTADRLVNSEYTHAFDWDTNTTRSLDHELYLGRRLIFTLVLWGRALPVSSRM